MWSWLFGSDAPASRATASASASSTASRQSEVSQHRTAAPAPAPARLILTEPAVPDSPDSIVSPRRSLSTMERRRPSSSEASNSTNTGNNTSMTESPTLREQRQHHGRAYDFINGALDFEAAGNTMLAEEYYRKGIREIQLALRLRYSPSEREQAEVLNSKMRKNLTMVEERLSALLGVPYAPSTQSTSSSSSLSEFASESSYASPNSTMSAATVPAAVSKPLSRASSSNHILGSKSNSPSPSVVTRGAAGNKNVSSSSSRAGLPSLVSPGPKSANLGTKAGPVSNSAQKKNPANIKGVDSKLASMILDEIVDSGTGVSWDDIAGLEIAKKSLQEIVILPSIRPELFTGLRSPARGLLLFGPPGTGKTMLAKAVAHEANATFFNISASSLTSKYVGESEKLVRALFVMAKELQPSIVFIDEIDSLLCERRDGENEASRRLKTEFLVQFDGVAGLEEQRVLIMGATNRPQELDEAARRRFVKRIYIPLPDMETRYELIKNLLQKHKNNVSSSEIEWLAANTEGYSGSDIAALARDAALGPIRELGARIRDVPVDKVRGIQLIDFKNSLSSIRGSVTPASIKAYEEWNKEFGTLA